MFFFLKISKEEPAKLPLSFAVFSLDKTSEVMTGNDNLCMIISIVKWCLVRRALHLRQLFPGQSAIDRTLSDFLASYFSVALRVMNVSSVFSVPAVNRFHFERSCSVRQKKPNRRQVSKFEEK